MYWLRPYLHAQHGRMRMRIRNECIAYEPDFHGNCTNLWRRRGPDHGRMHRQYNSALLGIPSEEETDLKTLSKLCHVSKSPTPLWWSQWSEIFFLSSLFSILQLMHRWGTWNIVVTVNSQTTKNTILSLFFSVLAIDPCIDQSKFRIDHRVSMDTIEPKAYLIQQCSPQDILKL